MGKQQKKKSTWRTRIATGYVAIVAVWGVSQWSGSTDSDSQLPSEVNGGQRSATSQEKNAQYEQEARERNLQQQRIQEENEREEPGEGLSQLPDEHMELPADIRGDIELYKSQFIISYNNETRQPNYVCWALTPDRINGAAQRTDYNFDTDPVLQHDMQVRLNDYSGSGYDRGHMCPAGDNENAGEYMKESFYMTNICPQAHSMNNGDWNDLECWCRDWVKRNKRTLYICCGPIFDNEPYRYIGNRKQVRIAVPDRFFKVVMTDNGENAIGFIMPNDDSDRNLQDYAVSVDEVERITGFDFFHQVPDELQDKAEAQCKPGSWDRLNNYTFKKRR